MENPFETLSRRLSNIENLLLDIKHAPKTEEEKPDRIYLKEVCELTGLKPPAVYKETSRHTNGMPCYRFGSRLVFSRKEILTWLHDQTVKKRSSTEIAVETLQASAKRKKG